MAINETNGNWNTPVFTKISKTRTTRTTTSRLSTMGICLSTSGSQKKSSTHRRNDVQSPPRQQSDPCAAWAPAINSSIKHEFKYDEQ